MRLTVATDAGTAARLAAEEIARLAGEALSARGRALLAFSGGETPWRMLEHLRRLAIDWPRVHVAQVDERIAPAGDPRRNLTRLEALLANEGPLPRANLHPMPVEERPVEAAADGYARSLQAAFGYPLRFDLVQLGLGADGHTASLLPGDAALSVVDRDVAVTATPHEGLRRMTLTYPALDRARHRLWLVTGAQKAGRLRELLARTGDAPAVRVSPASSSVFTDLSANAEAPHAAAPLSRSDG